MPLGDPTKLAFQTGAAGVSSLGAGVQQAAGSIAEAEKAKRKQQIDLISSLISGGYAQPVIKGEEPDFKMTVGGANVGFAFTQDTKNILAQDKQQLEKDKFKEKQRATKKVEQAKEITSIIDMLKQDYVPTSTVLEKDALHIPGLPMGFKKSTTADAPDRWKLYQQAVREQPKPDKFATEDELVEYNKRIEKRFEELSEQWHGPTQSKPYTSPIREYLRKTYED